MTISRGSVVVGYLDNGTWSACFGLSYRDAILFDVMKNRRIIRKGGRELRAVASSGNLPDSRNDVVRWFLDTTDGEWLFMVDTDMGFGRDAIEVLVQTADPIERPVMGGLAFCARKGPVIGTYQDEFIVTPTMYHKAEGVGFQPLGTYPIDAVVPVDGTGAAFILMHRTVLEQVREKYGDHWYRRIPTEDDSGEYSEDLSLCLRFAELGVPIHVNTAVPTVHHKGIVYLSEEMFLGQQGLTREGVSPGGFPRPLRHGGSTEDVPQDRGD